jgi:ABC-type nitrate/sulfonate/bicarbonate transport system substrate-binding protein
MIAAVVLAPAYVRMRGDDTVRFGMVIGTLGALRSALPDVEKRYSLKYDIKDFRDSTAAMLALDQGELDVANLTAQHLVRAINEGLDVVWVTGWGGGYNVLVARRGFDAPMADDAAVTAAIRKRKEQGKPVTIGVPTGSMQHAKLLVYLRSLGIDGERDVQIVNIPFPNHPRALEAGEVDMIMTTCVFGAIAIDKGDARLVRHIYSEARGKQEIGFAVNGRLMRDRPELVQHIVSSVVDAMDTFKSSADVRIALERKYSRLPDAVIAMQERQFLKYDYRTNIADLRNMARELRELGWVKEDYSDRVDKYVNLAFLARATGLSPAQLSTW